MGLKLKKIIFLLALSFLVHSNTWPADYCANSNMKAAYYLNESSGTLADCTSNANTCTATNSPGAYNQTGQFGGAFDFQEVNNSFLSCGSAASIDNLTSKSAGLWVYPDSNGNNSGSICDAQTFLGKSDGNDGWLLCQQQPSEIKFAQSFDFGRAVWTTTTAPVVTTGFQHIAVTYNGSSSSNDPIIYFNGVAQSQVDASPSVTIEADAGFTFRIATEEGNLGEVDARIDEPFYYSGILTSTEVNDIKDNGLTSAGVSIVNHLFNNMIIHGGFIVL